MTHAQFDAGIQTALTRLAALRDRAERTADPDARDLLAEGLEELGHAFEELSVAQEELRVQNETLAAAEATADVERERYRDLFENAPIGYLVTDADGVIR